MDHLDDEMKKRLRGSYSEIPFISVTHDVKFGDRVVLAQFVNLYGCTIGDDVNIGAYAEIGKGVIIGNRCKIGCRAFIPEGVVIDRDVFIGPGVIFTNDKHPDTSHDWTCEHTLIKRGASIGAGCTILPGIIVGEDAVVGAGTVLTHDVDAGDTVYNPLSLHVRPKELLRKAEQK